MIAINPMPRLSDGREPRVTSGYGPRSGGMGPFHWGVDMLYRRVDEPGRFPWSDGTWAVPDGVAALAAGDGTVISSTWTKTGDFVKIDHGDGWLTSYMHMRDRLVNVGDRVTSGQQIGTVSYNPWKSGGPVSTPDSPARIGLNHLHFEVTHNGQRVDPETVLGRHLDSLMVVAEPGGTLFKIAVAAGLGYLAYRVFLR